MPQSSYAYAVARVRVLEGRLLTRDRLARLVEAETPDEALRLLMEFNYGTTADLKTPYEYDVLILEELREAYDFLDHVSPDPALTDLFRLSYDAHNIKALLKSRLQEQSGPGDVLMDVGTIPAEKLAIAVNDRDYRDLPETFRRALQNLEKTFSTGVDPQRIGIELDKAVFIEIFKRLGEHPNAFARKYFKALADFQNVRILLRARARAMPRDELAEALLPEGDVSKSALLNALDQAPDALVKSVAVGAVSRGIAAGLEETFHTGSMAALERRADDLLLGLAREGKRETLGIGPLIGYLLAKEQEAKAVRLIMVAKLNGLDDAIVKERLRELYV